MNRIDEFNAQVVERICNSQVHLLDVKLAKDVCEAFAHQPTLLHSGPPVTWEQMPDPVKGSCVGALLFEGLANNETLARAMLESGQIRFINCHSVGFVGPMGGITSANMPVFEVINKQNGRKAYCNLNEGIGKVLRFGAYSEEVITRLNWIKNSLAPSLSACLQQLPEGLELNSLMARAITMGDEFHQRNIAASLIFFKEMMPLLHKLPLPAQEKETIIDFLGKTDQFFLNIAMAFCKATMDYAREIEEGSIVTCMARNGHEFGIKVSGLGDKWYTAPVNTPVGLFFSGYSQEDACGDMGDSAITETFGVGAMCMIAAPGVTRFVGAGGFNDAYTTSEEMQEICFDNNNKFSIPTWDFKGTPVGIDVRRVIETGITPVINTGIAHKQAGIGQIGAGTVRVPLECFEKALRDLHAKYGK